MRHLEMIFTMSSPAIKVVQAYPGKLILRLRKKAYLQRGMMERSFFRNAATDYCYLCGGPMTPASVGHSSEELICRLILFR